MSLSHTLPKHRWGDNIKMDFQEIACGCGLSSSGSGEGPMTGYCKHFNKRSGSRKGRKLFRCLRDY